MSFLTIRELVTVEVTVTGAAQVAPIRDRLPLDPE
jgi:hypothetical protein